MTDSLSLQRRMFAAVLARDFAALRALYHADYAYTGGDGVTRTGAESGLAVARTYTDAFPDLSFEFRHSYRVAAHTSVVELTACGTHRRALEDIPATGRSIELAVCNVIEVRDGRIYREREYFDTLSLFRQIGAL